MSASVSSVFAPAIRYLITGIALFALISCSANKIPEATEEDLAKVIPGGVTRGTACPQVEVRTGTQAYPVYQRGRDFDPQAVLYQGSVGETARECNFADGSIVMRVGVNGRVLRGPAGTGAQSVNLPIRIVVTGPAGNPVYSELQDVSLVLSEGTNSVPFSVVQENVVIVLQPDDSARNYNVLVGFDQPSAVQ